MLPSSYRWFVPVLLCSGLCLNAFVAWTDRDLILQGYPDFTGLYVAGQIVAAGQGSRLYDLGLQYQLQLAFASHVSVRHGALPYIHPPFEALLFVPFSFLPYIPAYFAWNGFNLVLLALAIAILRPHVPLLGSRALPVWLLVSIAYFPVFICLLQGQDMQLMLLAVAGAYASLKARNDFRAGCWLGLGLFRPQLVLPLFLILLLGRTGPPQTVLKSRIRLSGGIGLVAAFECAASIVVSGWKGFLHYPSYVWMLERNRGYGAIVPVDMPNIRGMVAAFVPDGHAAALAVIACVSAGVLVLAAHYVREAEHMRRRELGFSLALAAAVLISYHAFMYDLVLLLLGAFFLASYAHERKGTTAGAGWLLLFPVAVLFCTPLLMLLWLRLGRLNLLAPILLVWLWGISREISGRGLPKLASTWVHA